MWRTKLHCRRNYYGLAQRYTGPHKVDRPAYIKVADDCTAAIFSSTLQTLCLLSATKIPIVLNGSYDDKSFLFSTYDCGRTCL